jgi:hypothetical protein
LSRQGRRRVTSLALAFGVALLTGSLVSAQEAPANTRTVDQVLPLVNQYCGTCHAVPLPDVLAKRHWPAVVRTMVGIMQERTGKARISEQQMKDIIAFYYGSSPVELPLLPYLEEVPSARHFVPSDIGTLSQLPFVTNVNAASVTQGLPAELLVCDGESKKVLLLSEVQGKWREQPLLDVDVPVHSQVLDVDGDDDLDVLVADLGQFPPLDALVGRLLLFRQGPANTFTKELLLDKLGRVSDARAVDLDADGDLDIAIAVFGGGDVGEVIWLENEGIGFAPGMFRKHVLLQLAGAINVSPADLNGDGRMDLVVLIAQEHEMIVAFVNLGGGTFERGTIARAPHPMFGSTSMSTVDLDKDGDVDVLFTNGDAFDTQTDPKPYHGVQWLENKGQLRFEFHDIGRLYGAATALAGDMDGDGDLDVVAGSWVNYWSDPRRHALVWYENDGRQGFTPHGIASRPAGVSSLQLIDVNGDGALDIVAGAIRMDLLLAKWGASYKASRLFPPSGMADVHSRVIVFENRVRE